MKRALLVVSVLALAVVAMGQGVSSGSVGQGQPGQQPWATQGNPAVTTLAPNDPQATSSYAYTAAHGSLFDAGLAITDFNALAAVECEPRMLAFGVNNETSNIVSTNDTTIGGVNYRVASLSVEEVMLDAGSETIAAVQTGTTFWRELAGGDAGMPWFRFGGLGISNSGASRYMGIPSIAPVAGTAIAPPGYYCIVPWGAGAAGANVDKQWMRINRILVPK